MEVQDKHHRVSFASVSGKPVEAVFDGGVLTSDIGLMLLREVESKIGILSRIVEALTDRRHPSYVPACRAALGAGRDHTCADLINQRVFQIACGYEDANDCNALRRNPAFKAACDRLPVSGAALASQPTMSRLENGQPVQLFTCFGYQASPGHCQDASSTKPRSPLRGKQMHALSSPTWTVASPHSSTKPSIARAAGWKTSLRITKPFSIPIVPLVTRLKPITSVSSYIVPLMS